MSFKRKRLLELACDKGDIKHAIHFHGKQNNAYNDGDASNAYIASRLIYYF
jgi:hypothetical protein